MLTFTNAWNELLLALIFITSPEKQTVPVALQYLITGDVFRWGLIMAGSVTAARPAESVTLSTSLVVRSSTRRLSMAAASMP